MNKILYNFVFPTFNYLFKKFPRAYFIAYSIYKYLFEINKITFFKSKVKLGDNIVIVGANVGFYTQILSKLVGEKGKVYSFEPDNDNFKLLKKNCLGLKNVILEKKAVGEKNGYIKLYKSNSLNTDHQSFDIGEGRTFIKIKCVKLDSYFASKVKINLIKVDIQGYDYFAFKGMKKILKSNKKIIFMSEMWPYALNHVGINPALYISEVKKLGFKFLDQKLSKNQFNKYLYDKYYYTDFIGYKGIN